MLLHAGFVLRFDRLQFRLLVGGEDLIHLVVTASLLDRQLGFERPGPEPWPDRIGLRRTGAAGDQSDAAAGTAV